MSFFFRPALKAFFLYKGGSSGLTTDKSLVILTHGEDDDDGGGDDDEDGNDYRLFLTHSLSLFRKVLLL